MPSVTLEQAFETALARHQAGQFQEAESLYRQILAQQPNHPDTLHLLGLLTGQTGRLNDAVALIRQAIAADPNNPLYYTNLSVFLQQNNQIDEAIASLRRALALKPDYPEALYNLADDLRKKGQFEEAITCFRRVLSLKPDLAEAHNNLGNIYKETGQLDQALASYQAAIALNAKYAEAHYNLGNILKEKNELDRAIASFQQAILLKPDYAEAYCSVGNIYKEKGQRDQAVTCFQQALAINPNYAEAHNNLGNIYKETNRPDEAIACFGRALALNPNYAEAHNNLGNALREKKLYDQAIDSYCQALALKPDFFQAYYNLGITLNADGQLDQAFDCFQKALQLNPAYPEALNNLGNIFRDRGQLDQAIASYRQAIQIQPDCIEAHNNLIYILHFHPEHNSQSIQRENELWNRQHAHTLRSFIKPHSNIPDPARPLRIGYVSPDFSEHPIGRFFFPLISAHDHAAFQIFCYANQSASDSMTEKIKKRADVWRDIANLSDKQTADLIRRDQIDILVDLAMHAANNRLLVFARKPTPVQVTYLAYAGGAAPDTIDYRLTDRYLDPNPAEYVHYMQQSIRLGGTYWCYQPPLSSPAPANSLPALTADHITFGCLNNFSKITPPTLDTWATLLEKLPDSRLLLFSFPGGHRDHVRRFLQDRGIAPDRLEFTGRLSAGDYFKAYNKIDIALDPFPFAGGTTTCDALWMGVPVITLAGHTSVGRAGVSILSNAGLPELIAQTPEQYIQLAINLANDLPHLAQLRVTLRDRMLNSALMDAPRFARGIEQAYRNIWQTWCKSH